MSESEWNGNDRRRRTGCLPETEIENIAKRAARAAIEEMFELVGVDVSKPEGRKSFRDDLDWLTSFRLGAQQTRNKVVGAGLTVVVTGLLYSLWHGLEHK